MHTRKGLLLSEWADRCHLYAVSMSALSKGPTYTYFTAERQTTVDYIFVDSETKKKTSTYFAMTSRKPLTQFNMVFRCVVSIINAKLWRLLRAWYLAPKCQVRLNGTLSNQFSPQRGVRQGSVHLPLGFCL